MRAKTPSLRFSLTVLLSALVASGLAGCGTHAQTPEPPRPAIVAQPSAADASSLSYYSGEIRARHESQLGFRVGGKIERRLVDTGTPVKVGQVLAVLDPGDLRLDLAATQAALTSAQADAELAQAERDRAAALLDKQLISTSQFDARQTALAAAQARLQQARAQWAVSRNQVGYAELKADRAGIVTAITAEAGQVVAPGQVVAVLAQDGEPEVEIALPESQVGRYRVGTPAQISLWSDAERKLAGVIREIAPDADNASRTYRARVSLSATDAKVALGMTARVRFEDVGAAGQLRVPLTALHVRDEQPAVWTVNPTSGQVGLRPVTVATYHEDAVVIAEGLVASDWLVVAGVHKLHEGQVIRAIDRDNRPIQF